MEELEKLVAEEEALHIKIVADEKARHARVLAELAEKRAAAAAAAAAAAQQQDGAKRPVKGAVKGPVKGAMKGGVNGSPAKGKKVSFGETSPARQVEAAAEGRVRLPGSERAEGEIGRAHV